MTLYEVLLLFHILAAITWVGGAITINIVVTRIQSSGDQAALGGIVRQIEWMGGRVFSPASLVVLGLGIWMVAENDAWTVGQLWIILALVGIGITAITGAAYFGPEAKRITRGLDARGPNDPDVRRRIARITLMSRLDLLLLLLIVADMVLKPGL
jgi:uncharacterized membrane protein